MFKDEQHINFPDFLASAVHDMKNSLSMLLNTTEEIFTNCTPDNCSSYHALSRLHYEAKRVNNDLIQLLTQYQIDNSQHILNISHYSVFECIEEIVLHNKLLLDIKGIAIEVDCPDDLVWFYDFDLLSGIINNIINNVLRYTKDIIKISAFEENSYLVIVIEDNGEGYPEHIIKQGGQTMMNSNFYTGSTGLGLYFASEVARIHKNKDKEGYILLYNGGTYGGGCFKIFLP